MQLFTDEWREADRQLVEPLRPYHQLSDMGASMYQHQDRKVGIKHRMRKDKVAVVTLTCWRETGDGPNDYPDVVWSRTTAIPTNEQASLVGTQLLAYLIDEQKPIVELVTYPGYEDLEEG